MRTRTPECYGKRDHPMDIDNNRAQERKQTDQEHWSGGKNLCEDIRNRAKLRHWCEDNIGSNWPILSQTAKEWPPQAMFAPGTLRRQRVSGTCPPRLQAGWERRHLVREHDAVLLQLWHGSQMDMRHHGVADNTTDGHREMPRCCMLTQFQISSKGERLSPPIAGKVHCSQSTVNRCCCERSWKTHSRGRATAD